MQSDEHRVEGAADLVAQSTGHFRALVVLGGGHCGEEFLRRMLAHVVRSSIRCDICTDSLGGHQLGTLDCACSEGRQRSNERLIQRRGTPRQLEEGEAAVATSATLDMNIKEGGNIDASNVNTDALREPGHNRQSVAVKNLEHSRNGTSLPSGPVDDPLQHYAEVVLVRRGDCDIEQAAQSSRGAEDTIVGSAANSPILHRPHEVLQDDVRAVQRPPSGVTR